MIPQRPTVTGYWVTRAQAALLLSGRPGATFLGQPRSWSVCEVSAVLSLQAEPTPAFLENSRMAESFTRPTCPFWGGMDATLPLNGPGACAPHIL